MPLFTEVRGWGFLRTSALRSEKFTAPVRSPINHEDECHQHQLANPSGSFPGTPTLAWLILLWELVPSSRSLQGPLEPCQPLVPHMLPLARAQRREYLQRSWVRLTVKPHPRPPIDSLEGEPRSRRARSHPRLEGNLPIGLDSRVAHRSISNLAQMRCLLTYSESSTCLDRSLGGLLYGFYARVHRGEVGQVCDEPEHLIHWPVDEHCGIH
jgi:hypothetical protein